MAEKMVEMTVRRWIKATTDRTEYELKRANTWMRISLSSIEDYEKEREVAQSQLRTMYAELQIAWQNKPFRFLYRKPELRDESILVGDWATEYVREVINSSRYSYLTRTLTVVMVYIDESLLPTPVPIVSLFDVEAALEFYLHIHRRVERDKLKPGDKIAVPYSAAVYFRIPFNEKDIIEADEESAE